MAVPRIVLAAFDWSWTDPIGSISRAFSSAQRWAVERIQDIILDPSSELIRSRVVEAFTITQNALAIWLSYSLLGLILLITVLTVRNGRRLGYAFVVWVLLSALSPYWAEFVWELRAFGLRFAELLRIFEAPDISAFNPPGFDNPIAAMIFFGLNTMLGIALASLLAFYEMVIIMFQLWALPAVALSVIGPRSRKFSNVIIALGLTAAVGGRPAAIFFLEGAMWMIETLPFGGTPFGAGIYTMAGILAALVMQIVLVFVFYHAVVWAQSFGTSLVAGTVATTTKQVLKVDIKKHRANQNMAPMPVHIVSTSHDAADAAQAKKEARKRRAATAIDLGGMASGHPEAGAMARTILR